MSSEPKKVDRRKFIYAGLGAVALIAIGAAAYVAMNPPVVTQTVTTSTAVPTTSVVTTTVPTTSVVTTTVPTTSVVTTSTVTTVTTSAKFLTLDWWVKTFLNSIEEARVYQLKAMYESAYPNVKLSITQLPATVTDMTNKLAAAWTAGVGFPALAVIEGGFAPSLSLSGYLEPLDDLVASIQTRWGKELDGFIAGAFPKTMGPDKSLHNYFVPIGWASGPLAARFDIIEKAGLTADEVISSLTNFDKALYKIKNYLVGSGLYGSGEGQMYPIAQQMGSKGMGDGSSFILKLIGACNGIPVATEDMGVHVKQTPEQVNGVERAFTLIKKWYDDGILSPDAPSLSEYDNNAYFQTGKCVFTANTLGSIATWMDQNKPWFYPYYGWISMPRSDINGVAINSLDARGYAISTRLDPEVKKAAENFIMFYMNPENYVKIWGDTGGIGQIDSVDIPMYKAIVKKPPYTTSRIWAASAQIALYGVMSLEPHAIRPSIAKMTTDCVIVGIATNLILGKMTPKEAAAEFIDQLYKYIENMEGLDSINENSPTVLPPP